MQRLDGLSEEGNNFAVDRLDLLSTFKGHSVNLFRDATIQDTHFGTNKKETI